MLIRNKGRRAEIKKLKFKKRIFRFEKKHEILIMEAEMREKANSSKILFPRKEPNYNGYRNSSTPCSCFICRSEKYRDTHRRKNKKEGKEWIGANWYDVYFEDETWED